jgi:aspartyl-tRNA synthetase
MDLEMSFVTQEDVFSTMEPVLTEVFIEFGNGAKVPSPFPRITYQDAMDLYGSDKPDLCNPLRLHDVTSVFKVSEFTVFASAIEKGAVVKGIPVPDIAGQSRKFFDDLNGWAQSEGMKGLGYVLFENGSPKGPIAKFLKDNELQKLCGENGGVFFVCDSYDKACKYGGLARTAIAKKLNLIEKDIFKFCWIVDFPMYEKNEETDKIDFSHNPFSMPQGGLEALNTQDPLTIKAYQYDIVCNGIELSSGAIRNHIPEIMYRAFEIAGYSAETVDDKFKGMINALKFGAPPHGGFAPGIDRMVMLLCQEESIREIIAYPFNQQAQDLMMNAPASVDPKQLKELGLSIVNKK